MNSVYNYEYNKEIKDKIKAMINDKASSSETVLVPAYSYLAEVLREVNKSYDEIKLKNTEALLYESEVVTALELMQNIFSLYYLKVPVDIIDFSDPYVNQCMESLSFDILNHITKSLLNIIEEVAYKPDKVSLLSGHMIALQNKIVWSGL